MNAAVQSDVIACACLHPVDEVLPAPRLCALELQDVLVMCAGAIVVAGTFSMLAAPPFFAELPHSGILLTAVVAVGLNLFFSNMESAGVAREAVARTSHGSE